MEDLNAIEQHRPYLLRYALLRLRDEARAEDAVMHTVRGSPRP